MAGKVGKHLNLADWQLDKQTAKLRPSKVITLVPVSAHMPQWIPLKSFKISLFSDVICLVLPHASQIESDGSGFCM